MTKALIATGVISVIVSFFAHKEYDKYQHKKELEVARQQEIQRQINYRKAQEAWADSILRTMTTEEKIGQLFMVASWSNKDEQHFKEIDKLEKQEVKDLKMMFKEIEQEEKDQLEQLNKIFNNL